MTDNRHHTHFRMRQKQKPAHSKRKFVATFSVAMLLFAAIRHLFTINVPMLAMSEHSERPSPGHLTEVYVGSAEDEEYFEEELDTQGETTEDTVAQGGDTQAKEQRDTEAANTEADTDATDADTAATEAVAGRKANRHRIVGVHSWDLCFPDINDVQLVAARQNGIEPVRSRQDLHALIAEHRLVNIHHSPYYAVDELTHSMPYLVPKAQHMLNTICLNFIDSLQMKGLPIHLPMVTSVLRTAEDVSRLQKGNGNATTNSCHCYGTTVDITYNRFVPLLGRYDPDAPLLRWDEKMKQVLAEVLNDLRQQGLCYVKYERKQACFHLTVR